MIAELHGKVTGCAKGFGGSMHLIDLNSGVAAAVPIVGSTTPIGAGIAWANKLNKKRERNSSYIFWRWRHKEVFFSKAWTLHHYTISQFYLYAKIIIILYIHIFQKGNLKKEI